MPADPSGVTTDDQGSPGNGADDRSPAETHGGRSASQPTDDATASRPDAASDDEPGSRATRRRPGGDSDGNGGGGASGTPVANGTPSPGADAAGTAGSGSTESAAPAGRGTASTPTSGPGTDPTFESTAERTAETPTTDVGQRAGRIAEPLPGGDPGVAPPPGGPEVPAGPAGPEVEPPPAPVLTGPGAPDAPAGPRRRRVGGRHTRPRRDRAAMRGLRVNQRLWSVDPWSVFKLSILFYFCLALIVLVAGTLLYNAGRRVGTVDQFESFITRMGAYGECVVRTDVPEGTEFEVDEDECSDGEVLVGGFALDDGTLFRTAAVGGGILVLAGSIGNVLMTVLVNLLNELTGGLRHSVVKEPTARPRANGQARQRRQSRPAAARAPAPSGSPPQQPQG